MEKDKKIAIITLIVGTLVVLANPLQKADDPTHLPSWRGLGIAAMALGGGYWLCNYKK